jgi:hypothetical protein
MINNVYVTLENSHKKLNNNLFTFYKEKYN